MEPINRYLGLGKLLGDAAKESGRHVADDLDHIVRITIMGRQKSTESLDGVLATARDREDHRFLLALHVEEYRDVAMAAPGSGFVHADRRHLTDPVPPAFGPRSDARCAIVVCRTSPTGGRRPAPASP